MAAKPESLDDSMLIWAAESNLGIGEAALKRGASAKPKVKELCTSAADLYKLLIERKAPVKTKADADLATAKADLAKANVGVANEEEIKNAEAALKTAEAAARKGTRSRWAVPRSP